MDQSIQAIYEHGVLRPLDPVCLNEDEVVSVVIKRPEDELSQTASDEQRAIRQREILLRFVEKMESYPDNVPQDGLTNRDHDRIIYGS
ncbi:MAG: antitoxin family protein [Pirellulales bacterium]